MMLVAERDRLVRPLALPGDPVSSKFSEWLAMDALKDWFVSAIFFRGLQLDG